MYRDGSSGHQGKRLVKRRGGRGYEGPWAGYDGYTGDGYVEVVQLGERVTGEDMEDTPREASGEAGRQ